MVPGWGELEEPVPEGHVALSCPQVHTCLSGAIRTGTQQGCTPRRVRAALELPASHCEAPPPAHPTVSAFLPTMKKKDSKEFLGGEDDGAPANVPKSPQQN